MALSNMNKDVVTRLMEMIATDDNTLNMIKADHATYSKLTLLATQMHALQQQAQEVVAQGELNQRLQQISAAHKRVPGTIYHLYMQNNREVMSIVGPDEWESYEQYSGAFLYDFDHTFKVVA